MSTETDLYFLTYLADTSIKSRRLKVTLKIFCIILCKHKIQSVVHAHRNTHMKIIVRRGISWLFFSLSFPPLVFLMLPHSLYVFVALRFAVVVFSFSSPISDPCLCVHAHTHTREHRCSKAGLPCHDQSNHPCSWRSTTGCVQISVFFYLGEKIV